jgi:lichenan operon transcriptional antiterminator
MLNSKEKIILQYLYQHQDGFSTSKVLAEHLSYTDRTIRTYIKKMLSEISEEESGFTIVSKQGYGYRLQITDNEKYHQFLSRNQLNFGYDYSDATNRYKQILNKLVFEEECILFDDLADQLFVSRSTLSHDFKIIRQQLATYDLSIESKPYKGVYVVGEERQKRRFIIVGCFFVAMFVTPPDALSMIMLAIPMWMLFEIGLFFGKLIEKRRVSHS